jgi:ABC-type iron transport system FetAB ATPase subunit
MPSAGLLRIEALHSALLGPLSLELGRGEIIALYGPSGAGKSLLLRAIADLDPNEGRISLEGVAREHCTPARWRERVALLPAEPRWWADSVGEHFPAGACHRLEQLGFGPEVMGWKVARLSSGERQRLALLRMLENGPRVLLLDEPSANLDPRNTQRVEALVRAYVLETDAGALWVTHDQDQARRVAERMLRLEDARRLIEEAA